MPPPSVASDIISYQQIFHPQPLQVICIVCIILLAVALNVLVIHNICCNELKVRKRSIPTMAIGGEA